MKKTAYVASLLLVLILSSACHSQPATVEQPVTIRIGYLNIVASLPLFIAEEKGFLRDEGLKYEASVVATSNQLVDGLVAGNLDAFVESSAVPALAVELQSPGRVKLISVSEITAEAPFDSLLVKKESKIKSLQDLPGKKIGVFPGSTAGNLLKKYLMDKGVDVSKSEFLPLPPASQISALVQGSIDVLHAYEPTTAIALTTADVRTLSGSVYADMLSPNPQGVAGISSTFLAQHPAEAKRLVRALDRAMVFMREHDSEARQIVKSKMQLADAAAAKVVFLYMVPHSKVDGQVLQRYADMLTGIGELKGHVQVESLIYRD